MLRLADTDSPVLHLIYDMWDTMIENVKKIIFEHEGKDLISGHSEFFDAIHQVLESRWNKSNTPLHCMAHSLVPKYYCEAWLQSGNNGVPRIAPHEDCEVSMNRSKCFKRLFQNQNDLRKIYAEYKAFSTSSEYFSEPYVIDARMFEEPTSWWANHGASTPLLQALAFKLLNQPASSSCCERNWSTYSFIQNIKRNKLSTSRAEDLVFVHCNLRLLSRKQEEYKEGPTKYWDLGMSRLQGQKRKQPESNSLVQSLTEHDRALYNVIRSKQDMGIWTRDMKRETNLPDNVVNKSLKVLLGKNLIKEVVNIQNKGKKHYMATEFEPSKEITGGAWYNNEGNLDTEFIKYLKESSTKHIFKLKVATLEGVLDSIKRSGAFKIDITKQQIEEILRALVLDNEIIEVKSNGMGEFSSIPIGKVCYKCVSKGNIGGEPKIGAMASIPCGVCPRINQCTPDGIISPQTCIYYSKWLDF